MDHCPGALQHILFSSELFIFVVLVACGIGLCSKSAVSILNHIGSKAPCFASLQRYHSLPGVHYCNLVYVIYYSSLCNQQSSNVILRAVASLPHLVLVVDCGSSLDKYVLPVWVRGMFSIPMLISLSLSATVTLNVLHCNNGLTMFYLIATSCSISSRAS